MTDRPQRSLNHFSTFSFTERYWRKDRSFRKALHKDWLLAIREAAHTIHHYQTYGLERTSDVLVWCAVPGDETNSPERFFSVFAHATAGFSAFVKLENVLWGLTRRSEYSRARSAGEIDPFEAERPHPYLIVYPFTKTEDWYLQNQNDRQQMMNEHIRIGKQYRGITQLLLYSFGLQDHEFVVVYETDDLARFSELVRELRGTESRRYTKADTPVHVGVYQSGTDAMPVW